ncbi:hypothetical protein QT381_04060 [Galbitalea sp. SE-J8]|uniref:hypothetical protein n=1 Tax=Galbitalea sp. SE-J8 TaxID=3054952 RepID=UPI00259C88A0|nr:hypothetical protein [Galbitalea sp. SE-J8]MDM4762179.1 hypothetical protein [Galbitalea sp. SE-J8]
MGTRRLLAIVSSLVALALPFAVAAPAAADEPLQSCWVSVDTGQSLCVDAGEDLVGAVEEDGVDLDFGDTAGRGTNAEVVLSALYDDTGYGGATFIMSVSGGNCSTTAYGYTSLSPYGWDNRAESFRSYNGCVTAVFSNTNYGGTQYGYYTSSSNLGTGMNNQASSWRVQ